MDLTIIETRCQVPGVGTARIRWYPRALVRRGGCHPRLDRRASCSVRDQSQRPVGETCWVLLDEPESGGQAHCREPACNFCRWDAPRERQRDVIFRYCALVLVDRHHTEGGAVGDSGSDGGMVQEDV